MAKKQIIFTIFIAVLIIIFSNRCRAEITAREALERNLIKLPAGFKIEIYAENVPNARSLAVGPSGIVFVGSRDAGNVYALIDKDSDKKAEEVKIIDSGLNQPNGVALLNGTLYVAEISRILKYFDIETRINTDISRHGFTRIDTDEKIKPIVINDSYPKDEHHGWKYIAFGPDGKLYVPVGMPCNVCNPDDEIYGTITRINPDGTGREIFAKGIRNTVGFDWHPETKELWFTENGRDWMGDDVPPDELCKAPKKGLHFGFPFCHGFSIADPEFGKGHDCNNYIKPEIELAPHTAALGMKFYTCEMFGEQYKGRIFIAEHGSWNRKDPIGYRVMMVTLKNGKADEYKVFAEGWLRDGTAWGRPVDVAIMADGSMLVSDDKAGAVYRIYK